uniref:Uncharacterized protein n=1 Tax=Peronospora matthiolae TaxID=2874970 RepID=A0AAV1V8E8_9STRA
MNSCTLRPPNDRDLSDDIIGSVLEGRKSNRHFLTHDILAFQEGRPSHRTYFQPPPTSSMSQATDTKCMNSRSRVSRSDAAAALGLLSLMNGTERRIVPSPYAERC